MPYSMAKLKVLNVHSYMCTCLSFYLPCFAFLLYDTLQFKPCSESLPAST